MQTKIINLITAELQFAVKQIEAVIKLLDEGATIPFISRYRKEMTGGLDETQIGDIKDKYAKLQELVKRKETVCKAITEQEKMTSELKRRIEQCWNSIELEDIYLPYKVKRRTRAEIAREQGLEPLALMLIKQGGVNVMQLAAQYVGKKVADVAAALAGARDIIAEWLNENEQVRNGIRREFQHTALITAKVVKGKEEEAANYRDYFDFSEKLSRSTSHRILAMRRAEKEGLLRVDISPDADMCLERMRRSVVRGGGDASSEVEKSIADSYKRLLKPSIESEYAAMSKEKADDEAIRIFAENARQLLLMPPLGQKRVLAIDPGFRSGCKVVCLDAQGNLLHNTNIYPHQPQNETQKAMRSLQKLVEQYKIEAIAIGNGTASRETERLVTSTQFDRQLQVFVVSENGASIYSASKIARDEFPDYDVTVRGAVSIGRRLMDPLAELVKIDPKSIGVGQYQHDVDQVKLKNTLTQTVENVVNRVGVDVNTASQHLLTYVSGLGPVLAQNIVNYRAEHGAFTSRKQLMKVPKMGPKSFEQSAGFLRVMNAKNPLDNSAVHPESYAIVELMAKDLKCTVADLIADKVLRSRIVPQQYVTPKVGLPTINDILQELEKPGRDPREAIQVFQFDPTISTINDLKPGMRLPGIVTNITNFGAFVDVGIKENGLVHVSQMANRFVSNPAEVVTLHQHVEVTVLEVDLARKRVQLSMKG